MEMALWEYRHNLDVIVDLAGRHGVRVVFATQPVIWQAGLPEEVEDRLWFGGIGSFQSEVGRSYYSVEALERAMEMYNDVTRRVCETRQVECIDLAALLPRDPSLFYDDCHFNEAGSERTAEQFARYLVQRPPLASSLKR
jgi:hypothetical protein